MAKKGSGLKKAATLSYGVTAKRFALNFPQFKLQKRTANIENYTMTFKSIPL